jgi:hypothetical protein
MTGLVRARALKRPFLALTAATVLMLPSAGCGTDEESRAGDRSGANGSSSPAAGEASGGEFCKAVAGIEDDLSVLDLTAGWKADPQGYVKRLSTAAERFSTVEPPAPIVQPWRALGKFFSMANTALDGVDATRPEAIEQALKFNDEEAFSMVLLLPGQGETVGAFVQEKCGVDLGIKSPAVANVCDALDPSHLGSVFGDAVPTGENRRWGKGVVECVWDDRDGTEVGIVVGPADALRPDLLQGKEPIDTVRTGGAATDVYDGALGPLRAASGRTAVTEVGGTAVLASVRTGDMNADGSKAVALAGLMAKVLE